MMMSIEPPAAIHGIPLPTVDTSGDELFRMGLLYSTGQGGAPLDYVSAHMLFNLAAMRGSVEAKVYRKEISQEMASEDVAEAQRQAGADLEIIHDFVTGAIRGAGANRFYSCKEEL